MLARWLFWSSLGALAWTHVGYPLVSAILARVRARPVHKRELALDYPADKLKPTRAVSDGQY
jgi:hypothetical protein